jgi:hypothetical protein
MLWSAKCSLFLRYSDQSFVCAKKLYFIIDSLYIEPHAIHGAMKNIFLNLQYSTECCDALRSLRTVLTTLNTNRCVQIQYFCKCLDEEDRSLYFVRLIG